ncbi:hypothetical protein [Bradyrhizobium sp. Ai1a-2]|uniref:hypothetical protein n=1 Tax=Bradyrhizobium sp. Ai1a-2 TaxID=196490 RepID=UPI001FCBB39B|nr:hypothetical protein [Bradyrhizobium sp. Ai1a-2]
MLRCTGIATSTFGGGGGTKVFCSQPLKPTKADSRKLMRNSGAVADRTPSFNPQQADGRASFISVHQFKLASQRGVHPDDDCRDPPIATIGLQWNPKQKMIPRTKIAEPNSFKNDLLQERTSRGMNFG